MSRGKCIVCGASDHSCAGPQRQIIKASGVTLATGPMRVPRQTTRIGKTGYVGNVEMYDPKTPNISFVQHDDEAQPDEPSAALEGALATTDEPDASASSLGPEDDAASSAADDPPTIIDGAPVVASTMSRRRPRGKTK